MNISVLDAETDAAAWHQVLQRFPDEWQDPYFDPEYVRLFCFDPACHARLFVAENAELIWVHPFLIRPAVPGRGSEQDIESAYGFSGPVSNSDDPAFLEGAHQHYLEWMKSEQVIAEFVRFHPLINNMKWAAPGAVIEPNGHTLSIDLREPPEFKGRAMNSLKRAWAEGVEVVGVDPVAEIDRFRTMYEANMQAVDADSFYFFAADHFEKLAELLSARGFLLAAVREGTWLAASMFLQGRASLHYHLSAADFSVRIPGCVNAIVYEAARRGHEQGLKVLHLGGGRTRAAADSLFFFKQSMSTHQHEFHIGKRVVLPAAYEAVCATWRQQHSDLVDKYGNRILCYRYQS